MPRFQAHRYHDISCGHRVVGHEGKCRNLHGHNYRIHFTCEALVVDVLDNVGRVVDFSVIKERLCQFLEDYWDHRMLISRDDPILQALTLIDSSVVVVDFNPTAENIAKYLVTKIGPKMLAGTPVKLVSVTVEETAKCSATFSL